MSEFENLVFEYEDGFPGSGPNWVAYEKMKARGRYLEEENARLTTRNLALAEDNIALRIEIDMLREAARWIPVEERLPEEKTVILVFAMDRILYLEWYIGDIWFTHWRPLPEPPEVE